MPLGFQSCQSNITKLSWLFRMCAFSGPETGGMGKGGGPGYPDIGAYGGKGGFGSANLIHPARIHVQQKKTSENHRKIKNHKKLITRLVSPKFARVPPEGGRVQG